LPINQKTKTLESQQPSTSPDYQYFAIYTCNGEETKRNLTKPTQTQLKNDIAESLSNTLTSLDRKRQIERGKDLLRLIELELNDFREIFNLQPMDQYSSYVLRLCQVGLTHAQSQTMDDCLSKETQTESSRTAPYSSWTQIPPAFEGGHSGHVRYAQEDWEGNPSKSDQFTHKPHNLVIPNCDQQTLAELECIHCEFLDHHLLTMHRLKSSQSVESRRGYLPGDVVCVWKVDDISGQGSLEHALKCPGLLPMSGREMQDVRGCGEGIVSVLSESSFEFSMIVGGLSDGSLAVWNVDSEMSPPHQSGNTSRQSSPLPKIFQYAKSPDYLASLAFSENDKSSNLGAFPTSPIIALKSLICKSLLSNNFQFCSLDNRGNVNIWMALRLQPKRNHKVLGSAADLGLRPGGHARLIQLARFTYDAQCSRMDAAKISYFYLQWMAVFCKCTGDIGTSLSPFTTCLEVYRTADRFFIGSADGNIRQKCRVPSQHVYPEDFRLPFTVAAVTCLALHPLLPNVLIAGECYLSAYKPEMTQDSVAGYSDGQIALFSTQHPHPIFKWLIKVPSDWPLIGVKKVVWSPHRPSVVFCLATDGDIIAWSLLDKEQSILKPRAQTLIIGSVRERKVVDFSVAKGRSSCLAVCWQDGAEIHWLEEGLVVKQEDELLALETILNGLL
uniref:WD_REPEATS_REGION domain-containing protein n=1 Tax=Hydatigena taeniaeformis TaxID=6205 RepID=A0A0R3X528_HYDTA